MAGFLVDAYDFGWTTVIFSILYCIAIVLNMIELIYSCLMEKENFWIKSVPNLGARVDVYNVDR